MSDMESWTDEQTQIFEDAEQRAVADLVGCTLVVNGKTVEITHAVVLIEDLVWEEVSS